MRTACLGPEGSYSELAAKKLCPDSEIVLCRTFSDAVELLRSGAVDCAALPIENSIQGGVLQNLDLLQASKDLFAVRELVLPIDHRLAAKAGTRLSDILTVCSHEQAIGQCSEFLRRVLPQADCEFTKSTAESLSRVDDHTAGIVGAHVRAEGIVLSDENIADEKRNFTHFLLIKKGKENLPEHTEKIYICAVLAHRPGTLLQLLQCIAQFGLNLTKIESRPIKDVPGEYRFFIEFEGDYASAVVRDALEEIRTHCRQFRLLGAY